MAENIEIPSHADMSRPAEHPSTPMPKVGVLLVNLGTPAAATAQAVKPYLLEFLSDKRVVELPSLLWQPILRGIILNTRPKKSAAAYAKIWMEGGSPLKVYTQALAQALDQKYPDNVVVEFAMRYGQPAIAKQISALKNQGCDRILIAPLYPQYSAATTATVNDESFTTLQAMRWQPALRTLPAYHDDPLYIAALGKQISTQLTKLDFEPDAIIASFHGMPLKTLYDGDPYHCHCRKTARLLSEHMNRELIVSFQSRFGRAKWLAPATDDTLMALPSKGLKKVAIFAPGFAVDCVETLEELAIEGKASFMDAGGEEFAYLPCLNAQPDAVDMMTGLLNRELAGWV